MNLKNNLEKILLGYDDITLIPLYSEIMSRSDPDTSVQLGSLTLKTPIISANMDTVTERDMAIKMRELGGIGALHRFMSIDDAVKEYEAVRAANSEAFVTIGVKDYKPRISALCAAGARNFVIDIAHGHSLLMKNALTYLRTAYKDVLIMAGNVATCRATIDLIDWGADIIKVGVSAGSICKTRMVTGHGVPMFSSVLECSRGISHRSSSPAWLVADGGIKCSGDIVKAFVAGADAVMLGSLLAGTKETPGASVVVDGKLKKEYRGMASSEAQGERQWGSEGVKSAPEGVSAYIDAKGSVSDVVQELTAGLRSGMSYCNASKLSDIAIRAEWAQQTTSGYIEGTPHIMRSAK